MAAGLSNYSPDVCIICLDSVSTDRPVVSSHPSRTEEAVHSLARHVFHRECLEAWVIRSPSHPCCPICRDPISVEEDISFSEMTPYERGCSFMFALRRQQFEKLPEILRTGPIEDRFFKRIIDLAIERNSTEYVERFFQAIDERFPVDVVVTKHKQVILYQMFQDVMQRRSDFLIRHFYQHPLFEYKEKCHLIATLAREHRFELAFELAERIAYHPTTTKFSSLWHIYHAYLESIEHRNINLFHSLNRFPIYQIEIRGCLNMAVQQGQLEMVNTILETQHPSATQRLDAAMIAERRGFHEIQASIDRTISIFDKHLFLICLLLQFVVIGIVSLAASYFYVV